MKITPNLIKKNVQYQINCDSSKKKIPFSVPYVTIFLNNFLHLLLNPPKKIVKATLSRLLSSEFEESFTKPFITESTPAYGLHSP